MYMKVGNEDLPQTDLGLRITPNLSLSTSVWELSSGSGSPNRLGGSFCRFFWEMRGSSRSECYALSA